MTNPKVASGRFFQNTRSYVVLLSHPSGKGSVTIPGLGWVEGNFFARFSILKEGTPPKGAKITFSESDFVMGTKTHPVTLPPIVKPHTLKPAVEPPKTSTPAAPPMVVAPAAAPVPPPSTAPRIAPMAPTVAPRIAPVATVVPVSPTGAPIHPVLPATPVVPATAVTPAVVVPTVPTTPDKVK
jgi:hypothetical protein